MSSPFLFSLYPYMDAYFKNPSLDSLQQSFDIFSASSSRNLSSEDRATFIEEQLPSITKLNRRMFRHVSPGLSGNTFFDLPFNINIRFTGTDAEISHITGNDSSMGETFRNMLSHHWHRPVIQVLNDLPRICFLLPLDASNSHMRHLDDYWDDDSYYLDRLITPHGVYLSLNLGCALNIHIHHSSDPEYKDFFHRGIFDRQATIDFFTNRHFEVMDTNPYYSGAHLFTPPTPSSLL